MDVVAAMAANAGGRSAAEPQADEMAAVAPSMSVSPVELKIARVVIESHRVEDDNPAGAPAVLDMAAPAFTCSCLRLAVKSDAGFQISCHIAVAGQAPAVFEMPPEWRVASVAARLKRCVRAAEVSGADQAFANILSRAGAGAASQ